MSTFSLASSFPVASVTKTVAAGLTANHWQVSVADSTGAALGSVSVPYDATLATVPFTVAGINGNLGDVVSVSVVTMASDGTTQLDTPQTASSTIALQPVPLTFNSVSGASAAGVWTQTS